MEIFFLYAYPLVGFISLSAFIPQIKTLLKAVSSPVNISIKSWILWTFGSFLSFGYGVFVLEDLMFCLMIGMSGILNCFMVFLILYRRYVTFGACRDLPDVAAEYFLRAPYFGFCASKLEV